MQGAERREVVQATPAEGVANRAARPGVQMRYAKTPMAAEEVGRGAATLAMLAEKAQPAVQALHMQGMREDFLKGQMQFAQGKTYQQIRESGASYATVSGAAALHAQKVMNDTFLEGLTAITQEDHKLTPEQYTEKLGAISKGLFTGDQIVDDFMTELASTNVLKLAEAQTKAHEEWKVQETTSAARDAMLSYSVLEDEESDKALTAMLGEKQGDKWMYTGPIEGLNDADRKGVILEAAVLDLKQGSRKIIDKLGGMQGIRDRFSTTAAEESSIMQAFSQFQADKENEYSAEMQSDLMHNYRAVRTGAITFEQGLVNGETIAAKYGKGNKTLNAISSDVWGAANIYMNKLDADRERELAKQERLLEKAQADYMKELAVYTKAGQAVSQNALYALDKEETSAAFQLITRDIDAQLMNELAAGTIQPTEVAKTAADKMATAIDQYGVVYDDLANHATAAFNTNLIANDKGQVYEGVMNAYSSLAPLYDINPGLALKHLKTDAAKSMFVMAREMDLSTNFSSEDALKQAAANTRQDISPDLANKYFTTEVLSELRDTVASSVKRMAPSLNPFTTAKRGSVMEISTWELERAATDPAFLEQVQRRARKTWFKQPNLTPTQATALAMAEVQDKGAYVLGNIIVPEGDDNLHQILDMKEYTPETGAPHEAVVEWLKANGPKYFGKQWFDSEIATRGSGAFMGYLGTKITGVFRDVPEMYVSLDKGRDGYTLYMQPVLNDGSPGIAKKVPASEIGTFYREWRVKEAQDAPKKTRDNLIDPLNTM